MKYWDRHVSVLCLTGFVIMLFFLLVHPAKVFGEEKAWHIVLNQQLLAEKDCKVNFLTNIREFKLAGENVLEARAHCVDGRSFDASRKKKHLKFELKMCQPTIC